MNFKPIYIFDLDGTLADNRHRLPVLTPGPGEQIDWNLFHNLCEKDTPIQPIVHLMQSTWKAGGSNGVDVWIWTGRDEQVREHTLAWFRAHGVVPRPMLSYLTQAKGRFRMRKHGDHRPDTVVKLEWLNELDPRDRVRVIAIEDRSSVVKMWRENDIPCIQVCDGDY
jgi:hypothetical protein